MSEDPRTPATFEMAFLICSVVASLVVAAALIILAGETIGLLIACAGLVLLGKVNSTTRRVLLRLARPAEGAVAAYLGAWVAVAQSGTSSEETLPHLLAAVLLLVALGLRR